MKNEKPCYEYLKRIREHVERSEELLKILVANELIDQVDVGLNKNINECEEVCEKNQIIIQKEEEFYDKTLIYIQSKNGWTTKKIQEIEMKIRQVNEKFIPIFMFERFRGTQRNMLEKKKISYVIVGKEQHIYDK